jgi:hypothetical protein
MNRNAIPIHLDGSLDDERDRDRSHDLRRSHEQQPCTRAGRELWLHGGSAQQERGEEAQPMRRQGIEDVRRPELPEQEHEERSAGKEQNESQHDQAHSPIAVQEAIASDPRTVASVGVRIAPCAVH